MLRLFDIITENGIIPRLKAETREEAVYEIVDFLVSKGRIKAEHLDDLVVEIIKRETLGSTGIGHGVAIPHVKTDKVSDFVGCFAASTKGIEFNSIDSSPVKVIILFISPRRAISGHLQLLSHIGGILRHQGYLQLLCEAESKDDFEGLLKDAERMIFGLGAEPDDDDADAILA